MLSCFARVVPEVTVASSTFQGSTAATQSLGPLNMDFPQWNSHITMEELSPTCQIPSTVSTSTPQTSFPLAIIREGFWKMLVCGRLCCLVIWRTWRSSVNGGRSWSTPSFASGETTVLLGDPRTSCGATKAEKAVDPLTSSSRLRPPGN